MQRSRQFIHNAVFHGFPLIWLLPITLLVCGCSLSTGAEAPPALRAEVPSPTRQQPQVQQPAGVTATVDEEPQSPTPVPTTPAPTAPTRTVAEPTPSPITPEETENAAPSLATPTPQRETERAAGEATAVLDSAPAPAPVGTVVYYEESITLPTYPYERYQTSEIDPRYNWPYQRFDMERFRAEAPTPEPRSYRLLVLENAYLKLSILPELGGRIWQVIHKPTGAPIFYQNSVVKPTHWGVAEQLGWMALGGIEWGLPVAEHGYDWGVPWGYIPLQHSEDLAAVTVFTPRDGRLLTASITISLRAGAASFDIEPTLTNLAEHPLAFSYWQDAMLAPGSGKKPSADLRFILPTDRVRLHSTNDATLPLPGESFSWPLYQGRDFSRVGNYTQYLGFFEEPAAHGPFVAAVDPTYDVGVVRIFPPEVMRGSKVFSLGWRDALESSNFTDDDSAYVEMHGGLAPTFGDEVQLPAAGAISWREVWYPVTGLTTVSVANEIAALAATITDESLQVGIYGTRPLDGSVVVVEGSGPLADEGQEDGGEESESEEVVHALDSSSALASIPFQTRPDAPFHGTIALAGRANESLVIQLQDSGGHILLTDLLKLTP